VHFLANPTNDRILQQFTRGVQVATLPEFHLSVTVNVAGRADAQRGLISLDRQV
jgi:hypothetical protein